MRTIHGVCASSRLEGCTLLGALSVTTGVRGAITIVHGPEGCSHHNFSLLHATLQEQRQSYLPQLLSTALGEEEIIFGGEEALEKAIAGAIRRRPDCIYVLSTCIADTIGDDLQAICRRRWGVPVVPVESSGFLGGGFERGMISALIALSRQAVCCEGPREGVVLVGEKNLEFEVEENFREVSRLLGMLGARVQLRLARGCTMRDLQRLGTARLNVLREPALSRVGEALRERFGTPFIPSFPVGFAGTIEFLRQAGEALCMDAGEAIALEKADQRDCIRLFEDIRGAQVCLDEGALSQAYIAEAVEALSLRVSKGGARLPVPVPPPVGTAGMRRMLHRWRRTIHAGMR